MQELKFTIFFGTIKNIHELWSTIISFDKSITLEHSFQIVKPTIYSDFHLFQ